MARPLTAQERLRYPWASCINDYVPVGRLRKVGLAAGVGGLFVFSVGILGIYIFTSHLNTANGLPTGPVEWVVYVLGWLGMAAGFVLGGIGAFTAVRRAARAALMWSVAAMAPTVLWLLVWVVTH